MKLKDAFIVVGCPLSPSFRADARTIGMLESWLASNVITYYPSSGAAEYGYDKIVRFAKNIKPKPTHILFVDYDVLPRGNTLIKLLENDKDIVSGTYPTIKKNKLTWCLSRDEDFKLMPINDLPRDPFKASVISNGMMLVRMGVFDKLEWPFWRSEYTEDGGKLGADLYFCYKAKKAGYDLWVDPKIVCGHFKMVDLLGMAFMEKSIDRRWWQVRCRFLLQSIKRLTRRLYAVTKDG